MKCMMSDMAGDSVRGRGRHRDAGPTIVRGACGRRRPYHVAFSDRRPVVKVLHPVTAVTEERSSLSYFRLEARTKDGNALAASINPVPMNVLALQHIWRFGWLGNLSDAERACPEAGRPKPAPACGSPVSVRSRSHIREQANRAAGNHLCAI
jgi:hypothetical protein